jgi:LysR family transcriptional regulator, transcriptional activator for bauABCD operon
MNALASTNFRLLQLFMKIVEHGGFTKAQAALNLGQSTISTQMSALEAQLGVRLCHRGRSGFRLTEEGEKVYQAAQQLLAAVADFQNEVTGLRSDMAGELVIGVVDNIATNPRCHLAEAIQRLRRRASRVAISIIVESPDELELAILDGRCHLGIGSFFHHVPGLRYEPLFEELQELVCARNHPLFGAKAETLTPADVSRHDFVAHGYARQQLLDQVPATAAFHMEAVALLILSGKFIGYLPDHYAQRWVDRGEMRVLLPEAFNYRAGFSVLTRSAGLRSSAAEAFLADLAAAHENVAPRPAAT